jgi:hypothetical protein
MRTGADSGRSMMSSHARLISRPRAAGFPQGCRATNSRQSRQSLPTRDITWTNGVSLTQDLLKNAIEPLVKRLHGFFVRWVIRRIEDVPSSLEVILRRGSDLVPVDPVRRVVIPARFCVKRMQIAWIVGGPFHRGQLDGNLLLHCTHKPPPRVTPATSPATSRLTSYSTSARQSQCKPTQNFSRLTRFHRGGRDVGEHVWIRAPIRRAEINVLLNVVYINSANCLIEPTLLEL